MTARSGRTGKGRFFIPNILNETYVDNVGVIDGGARSSLQGFVDQFLADLNAAGNPMVLLHNSGAPFGTTPTPVISLALDGVIATQRRRLR